MQLPIKAHYATVAMLALAEQYELSDQVAARVIARQQEIPSQFLGQILQQLRSAGLITSTRGASGGFRLARQPDSITIAEIIDALCSSTNQSPQVAAHSTHARVVLDVWGELDHLQREMLEKLTLGSLLNRLQSPAEAMFYI